MNVVPLTPTEPSFDDFYLAYVRHEARKDAMKAWLSLNLADRLQAIIGALAWRKNYLARERCHVPLPATFLRGERWTDELPSVVSTQQLSHIPFEPTQPVERGVMPDKVRAELERIKQGMRR